MNNKFSSKGSLWRKWDLQIHTPGTKLSDQYKTKDGIDVWDKFIDCIVKSDVAVFGITDYFSIDGYENLLRIIREKDINTDKVFFPNIEFRLDTSTNKKSEEINIHLIFDNELDPNRIHTFLDNLDTLKTKNDGTFYKCSQMDLNSTGYESVCVSFSKLKKSLKNNFGNDERYLIVAAANGLGGLRADKDSPRKKILSDEIEKDCHFFFGRAQDRKYFLTEDHYEDKTVKASKKPVVTTSDCHSFEDCDNFLGKQYRKNDDLVKDITWIKADTSFEGLKQILYEPEERVAYGYEKPDLKKPYFVIDKVCFINNTDSNNFPKNPTEINHNLTAIIGGKSTGKSLLLYYLAKTIDSDEVNSRYSNTLPETPYTFHDSPDFNFEVSWADGKKTLLQNIDNADEKGHKRKILYIPQNYLNRLSEKNVGSKETLNKVVQDILLQDETLREAYDSNIPQIKNYSKAILNRVVSIYQLRQDILETEENIKQMGEEDGIKAYVTLLQEESTKIKSESGLSDEESKSYEEYLSLERETASRIAILTEDNKIVEQFLQDLSQQLEYLSLTQSQHAAYISDEEIKEAFGGVFSNIVRFKSELLDSVKKVLTKIEDKILSQTEVLDKKKKTLEPIMNKMHLQDELEKKNAAIKQEQETLDIITLEKKKLDLKISSYTKERGLLLSDYEELFQVYDSMRKHFEAFKNKYEDISLNISVGFNERKFNDDVVNEYLNKPDIKRSIDTDWRDEFEYRYDAAKHLSTISTLVNDVLDSKISTIKGREPRDAVTKILENYFDLDFKITYKNDPFEKMSPGKKGLVLLRLLIHLSNEEWPILLDQPEDDLDNRSVYDDLVAFIKEKKKHRQIIVVTHNPNLVVGADAEEIIVANQDGQESGRDNKKFKFEYVSGALENSFEDKRGKGILFRKGTRQHVCEILEGGIEAFQQRERKYSFPR